VIRVALFFLLRIHRLHVCLDQKLISSDSVSA